MSDFVCAVDALKKNLGATGFTVVGLTLVVSGGVGSGAHDTLVWVGSL